MASPPAASSTYQISSSPDPGDGTPLYSELWHASAGLNTPLAKIGSRIVYCPQGHMEQIAASMNQGADQQIPSYNLPSHLVCCVLGLQLKADPETDEVYAQYTLLPESESADKLAELERDPELSVENRIHVFCKTLTPSDTSTHGGFSVPKKAARECLPPLDYAQEPPAQELVLKDLHGIEWKFRHIYRGFPKRHLLTTGWSVFVSQKRLVAGDGVIFIRGANGQMRIGLRRTSRQQTCIPSSVLSSHSMQMGVLAAAAHAVSTTSMFKIFYNPRTSPSNFVIPFRTYVEALKSNLCTGTRVKITVDTEALTEQRNIGTIIEIKEIDPGRWPGSKWRSIKVDWDEKSRDCPLKVSPWDIEPIVVSSAMNLRARSRSKRQRCYSTAEDCSSVINRCSSSSYMSSFPTLLKDQVHACCLDEDRKAATLDTPPISVSANPLWSLKQENMHHCDQGWKARQEVSRLNIVQNPKEFSVFPHLPSGEPIKMENLQLAQQESYYTRSWQPDQHQVPNWNQTLPPPNRMHCSSDMPRHVICTDLQLSQNTSNILPTYKNSQSVQQILNWPNLERTHAVPSCLAYGIDGITNSERKAPTSLPLLKAETSVTADRSETIFLARSTNCNQNTLHLSCMVSRDEDDSGDSSEGLVDFESGCKLFGVALTKDAHNACGHRLIKTDILKTGERDSLEDSGPSNIDRKEHDFVMSSNLTGQEMASTGSVPECSMRKIPAEQPVLGRRCTKVHKQGNAVGRAIDLARFMGYKELFEGLEDMFKILGELTEARGKWQVIYTDEDGDIMLVGDEPWEEFCCVVRKIFIFSNEEVQKLTECGGTLKKAARFLQEETQESSSKCSVGNHGSSSQMTVTCKQAPECA